jgi:hypothetical protein
MDEQQSAAERPKWVTDALLTTAIDVFRPKSTAEFGESEAVALLVTLGQLLEVTGMFGLESENEAEEVHWLGESQ